MDVVAEYPWSANARKLRDWFRAVVILFASRSIGANLKEITAGLQNGSLTLPEEELVSK